LSELSQERRYVSLVLQVAHRISVVPFDPLRPALLILGRFRASIAGKSFENRLRFEFLFTGIWPSSSPTAKSAKPSCKSINPVHIQHGNIRCEIFFQIVRFVITDQ